MKYGSKSVNLTARTWKRALLLEPIFLWHSAGREEQSQGSDSCDVLHWFNEKGTTQGGTINNYDIT